MQWVGSFRVCPDSFGAFYRREYVSRCNNENEYALILGVKICLSEIEIMNFLRILAYFYGLRVLATLSYTQRVW